MCTALIIKRIKTVKEDTAMLNVAKVIIEVPSLKSIYNLSDCPIQPLLNNISAQDLNCDLRSPIPTNVNCILYGRYNIA